MIIFDETPIYNGMDDEYFNKNYKNYWLSVGRLSQAFFFYLVFLVIIIIFNIVFFVLSKCPVGTKKYERMGLKETYSVQI